VALPAGVDAYVPGGVGVVEVEQAVRFCRGIGRYWFFRVAAVQACAECKGKKYGYAGKGADGWKFP